MYPGARVGLKCRSSGKVLTSGILRRRSRASRGHTEARRQAWTGPPPGPSLAWPLTAGVQLPELEAPASVVAPACGVCSWFLGLAEGFPVVNFSLSFHGVCCLQRCCRLEKELILRSAGEGPGAGPGNLSRPAGPPTLRGLCGWPAHPCPKARPDDQFHCEPAVGQRPLPRASPAACSPPPTPAIGGPLGAPLSQPLRLSSAFYHLLPFPAWSWETGGFSENREPGLQAGALQITPLPKKPEKEDATHRPSPSAPHPWARHQNPRRRAEHCRLFPRRPRGDPRFPSVPLGPSGSHGGVG